MPFIDSVLRSVPAFKGKHRLSRLLLKGQLRQLQEVQIATKSGCQFVLPNIKESIAFDLFINGVYEPETNSFLSRMAPQNGCILDIGANIGSIVIQLLKTRPDLTAICIEASPRIFNYLQRNIGLNKLESKITLLNRAVWFESHQKMPFYSPTDEFGKGSLSATFTQTATEIETVTIDELAATSAKPIDLIKIDIEGFEYFAFKGGQDMLSSERAPDIFFEFVDWAQGNAKVDMGAEQALLRTFGYKIYHLREGRLIESNENVTSGAEMLFCQQEANGSTHVDGYTLLITPHESICCTRYRSH